MDKDSLIISLNSRLGIADLEEALTEIDNIISVSIRFWSRYNPSASRAATNITVTGTTYVFTGVVPKSISSIYNLDNGSEFTDYNYSAPLLSDMTPGNYVVSYGVGLSSLSDFETLPDLLEDLIYGNYCKAINHALNIGKIQIPIELDTTSILAEGDSLVEESKRLIIEQKDPE